MAPQEDLRTEQFNRARQLNVFHSCCGAYILDVLMAGFLFYVTSFIKTIHCKRMDGASTNAGLPSLFDAIYPAPFTRSGSDNRITLRPVILLEIPLIRPL